MDHGPDLTRRAPFARQLFKGLAGRYDILAEVLSFGQNRRWRKAMVDPLAATGPRSLLDVATGPAGVALQLAARTGAGITALDITPEMLRRARANVDAAGLVDRIRLVLGSGDRLPFRDRCFDGLTFTYLLRYVEDPAATLGELARVVRPGGIIASLDFQVPPNPVLHGLWWIYTRWVLPVAGFATGGAEWFRVGRFLGPSISGHYARYPLRWHVREWEAAGISVDGIRVMSLGGGLVMWGTRR